MRDFAKWMDTFIAEKGIDLDAGFTVDGPSGPNHMTYRHVTEAMKTASANDQGAIKDTLVKIDYKAGNVQHFLRHAARAIAR